MESRLAGGQLLGPCCPLVATPLGSSACLCAPGGATPRKLSRENATLPPSTSFSPLPLSSILSSPWERARHTLGTQGSPRTSCVAHGQLYPLCASFCFCKMGAIVVLTSRSCC